MSILVRNSWLDRHTVRLTLPVDPNPAVEPAVLAADVVCPIGAFLLGMPRILRKRQE
jgi:hypothetical protein